MSINYNIKLFNGCYVNVDNNILNILLTKTDNAFLDNYKFNNSNERFQLFESIVVNMFNKYQKDFNEFSHNAIEKLTLVRQFEQSTGTIRKGKLNERNGQLYQNRDSLELLCDLKDINNIYEIMEELVELFLKNKDVNEFEFSIVVN